MSKQRKYLIPQDTSVIFYAVFIVFVLLCLAGAGTYYHFARDTLSKLQLELNKLQEQVDWCKETNIQQNHSLIEAEKEIEKIKKEIYH